MLSWLTQRHMSGGLVFGPPGWTPGRIETTFDLPTTPPQPASAAPAVPPPAPPANRPDLLARLHQLNLTTTSPFIPALANQLTDLAARPLKGLLLNLLPAQPESALAGALCQLAWDDLSAGFTAIAQATSPKRLHIALDRHDHASRRQWRLYQRQSKPLRLPAPPRIFPLLNRYPQAHPTLLFWTLLGKRLHVHALPSTRDWLMLDAVTCWALGRHLRGGLPFDQRPVQLFDEEAEPRLLMARLGEPLPDFCRRHGITRDLPATQIILNGMLAGTLAAPDFRITGDTESIALRQPAQREEPTPCIACGWCVDVCPTGLNPVALLELAQQAAQSPRLPRAARESRHCIACGLCTYVCPTRLPLMQQVLDLRAHIRAARKEVKNAS